MFAVWLVWKSRNRATFEGKNPDPNLLKEIIQRATKFFFCAYCPKVSSWSVVKWIRWERPMQGWVKLNTDEASLGNPSMAGGGVIRDENGG